MATIELWASPRSEALHAVDRDLGVGYRGQAVTTLCGRYGRVGGGWEPRPYEPLSRICRTCTHAADVRDITIVGAALDEGRVLRARAIPPNAVREVSARVFRVHGREGVYTVTVPIGSDLAASCTCRDGKMNPGVVCKHQARVRLNMVEGRDGMSSHE